MKLGRRKSLSFPLFTGLLLLMLLACNGGGGGGTDPGPVLDNNALLSSLALSVGTLSPVFSSATPTYTSDVSVSTVATGVTASTGSAKATMKINGTAVVSGATHTVALPVGQTAIAVVVTAEDGTNSKTYTITANRPGVGLSPASVNVTAGHTATLNAVLASAAAGDTVVTLSSANTGTVTVPASVTVLDGNTQAGFTVSAIADGPAAVTILATLNSDTATATVNVLSAACGNGTIDLGEACDDNDIDPGDGCSAVCQAETGWTCSGEPSACNPICGDSLVRGGEQCDDGFGVNGTTTCGCQNTCINASASVSCTVATACTNEMFCDGAGSCNTVTNKLDGTVCSLDHALASCTSGVCVISSCDASFANCDGSAATGCETDTSSDASNCGSCGNSCTTKHLASAVCTSGACSTTCAVGYQDCNGDKITDGCETNLLTDVNNCGGCGNPCGVGLSCVSGVCQVPDGTPCNDSNVCTTNDQYTGGVCAGATFAPSTQICRDGPVSSCQKPEYCTGSSAVCPTDELAPAGTVCRASAGACDVADTCDGVTAACPADVFEPPTTVCRTSSGICDILDYCDGFNSWCSDNLAIDGLSCGPGMVCQAGVCQ